MTLNVDEMIDNLILLSTYTSETVVNEMLDKKDEVLPGLVSMVADEEYWYDYNLYHWAPVCALHILSKINNAESREAIRTALLNYHEYTADWITDDASQMLAHMGVDAIEMLTSIIQDSEVDKFVRDTVARALIMIAKVHPESKDGIVQSIKDVARSEPDVETRSLIIDALLDLKDPDLYEYLRDAVETGFVDAMMYDVSTLDDVYDGNLPSSTAVQIDPLDIFAYRGNSSLWFYSSDPPFIISNAGRNDSCPCGSGKKFKKCCLKMMQRS